MYIGIRLYRRAYGLLELQSYTTRIRVLLL